MKNLFIKYFPWIFVAWLGVILVNFNINLVHAEAKPDEAVVNQAGNELFDYFPGKLVVKFKAGREIKNISELLRGKILKSKIDLTQAFRLNIFPRTPPNASAEKIAKLEKIAKPARLGNSSAELDTFAYFNIPGLKTKADVFIKEARQQLQQETYSREQKLKAQKDDRSAYESRLRERNFLERFWFYIKKVLKIGEAEIIPPIPPNAIDPVAAITVTTAEFGPVVIDLTKPKKLIDPFTQELINLIKSQADIESAEPDFIAHLSAVDAGSNADYPVMWNLNNTGQSYPAFVPSTAQGNKDVDIDAPEGWNLGSSPGGQGVVVAVIDTGIDYTHEDFGGCTLAQVNDGDPNTCPKFVPGYNFTSDNNDTMDEKGHGTHVAGTIAALNNQLGIVGVAYNAKLMSLKVFGKTGGASETTIAAAVRWAVDHGADVINNSYGGCFLSSIERAAFKYAYNSDNDPVLVAAAGNDYRNIFGCQPAEYDEVITVSASDSIDKLAFFSNFGAKVDVAAPGMFILSLRPAGVILSDSAIYHDKYAVNMGTSMSAPHVSGVAAALRANYPNFILEQVRQAIRTGADDVGPAGFDESFGFGRLNLAGSLALGGNIPSVAILSPNHSRGESLPAPATLEGAVTGLPAAVASWGFFYRTLSATTLVPITGAGCSGQAPTLKTTCVFNTNGLAGDYYLVLQARNNQGKIFSDYKKINIVEKVVVGPPSAPLNLTADGVNPSPYKRMPRFAVNWKEPAHPLGFSVFWHKLGSPPLANDDGADLAVFETTATQEGGQKLYVWLEDSAGNQDYKNYAMVDLRYDATAPAAPSGLSATVNSSDSATRRTDFNIDWINPVDYSGIKTHLFKVGGPPAAGWEGIRTTDKPFSVISAAAAGEDLYVWLEDNAGNSDFKNTAKITLRYNHPIVFDNFDFNHDSVIGFADFFALADNYKSDEAKQKIDFDINGDGAHTFADITLLLDWFGKKK